MKYAIRKEEYQFMQYNGADDEQELKEFVGEDGDVTTYLNGHADIYFYDNDVILRLLSGWYIVKSENTWGGYPEEEFETLFEVTRKVTDNVVPLFKPAQRDLYIVGKQGTADHPNYNTDCIVDDVHAFTELMDKEGYKFDFQDDGGFHYYHPMTGETIWLSRIYQGNWEDYWRG